jgi:NAD+ diphosphatase
MRAWYLVHPRGIVVRRQGDTVTLPTDADVVALSIDEAAVLEVAGGGEARASAVAVREETVLPPLLEVISLREVFGLLGDAGFLAAGRATQLVEWATTSRFCGRCGSATEPVGGERCTRCLKCGLLAYPRIAPAIIVLVRRGDEAILARNARSKMSFYSTLAGFVEVGESLEQTVVREVREEVGVEVENVRYFGSQSWPFPHSLMVGFNAEWKAGDIRADGVEIVDAKWFQADSLPIIPPPISISRRLIDAWTTEVLRAR